MKNLIETKMMCKCGCGQEIRSGCTWVHGHNGRMTYTERYGVDAINQINSRVSTLKANPNKTLLASIRGRASADKRRGKTYEEIFGNKATEIKQKCLAAIKDTIANRKGKTLEEIYGNQAIGIRERQSLSAAKRTLLYGCCQFSNKGIYNGIRYESSYELDLLKRMIPLLDETLSIKRCQDIIPYADNVGRTRHYSPDFSVFQHGKVVLIVEVKCEKRMAKKIGSEWKTPYKFVGLTEFCLRHKIIPCLFTDKFMCHDNPDLSSLKLFIEQMNLRFVQCVNEKEQRLAVEDKVTNNTAVGVDTNIEASFISKRDDDIVRPLVKTSDTKGCENLFDFYIGNSKGKMNEATYSDAIAFAR